MFDILKWKYPEFFLGVLNCLISHLRRIFIFLSFKTLVLSCNRYVCRNCFSSVFLTFDSAFRRESSLSFDSLCPKMSFLLSRLYWCFWPTEHERCCACGVVSMGTTGGGWLDEPSMPSPSDEPLSEHPRFPCTHQWVIYTIESIHLQVPS